MFVIFINKLALKIMKKTKWLYSQLNIMSCWNWVKPSQRIGIERNWCVWAEHWRGNSYSTERDTTKLSSSMTMFCHISQDPSRHTWKRWNGRSYSTRCTLQTLLFPTAIFFDRWHTAWLIIDWISFLVFKKMCFIFMKKPAITSETTQ